MSKQIELRKNEIFEKELLPHINALTTFAYHLTYNDEDARDLVQETFLKAYKSISGYTQGTNSKAWLFKILKNAYINDYRKKVKRPTEVDFEDFLKYLESSDQSASGPSDLRTDMYQNLIGDEVTVAINSLPMDFKTVILLCDVEGFTYEEISKITDIPIGTVRSRLHRGRKMLKEKLRKYAATLGYKDKKTKK
ncbi:MAG TPA: sigma-70 family RNA polymerase sigma factor [Saprospiraceae bacterium]|nr:sigma-70 family RNA polymerase sigma factor [Saprospiraceae bacterium]HQW54619.1 sigma-70 family RNA polymerase sigma factor [Saprospiraceae bacterium]